MAVGSIDPHDAKAQQALCEIAVEAARAGGAVARRHFGAAPGVRLKADRSEVSDADHQAQATMVDIIRAYRPADAFLTEETLAWPADCPPPPAPANNVVCWVIDPIDGTRNFVRGIPLYACSVAVMFGGVPLAGAIYDPPHDRLYSATQLGGLFVDRQPRRQPAADAGRPAGFNPKPVVGLPSSPSDPAAALAHRCLDQFVCRNLGATCLHLALVANGELDAMLADNPRLWDLAAGYVLIKAAGGRMQSPTGADLFPLDVQHYAGEEMPAVAGSAEMLARLLGK